VWRHRPASITKALEWNPPACCERWQQTAHPPESLTLQLGLVPHLRFAAAASTLDVHRGGRPIVKSEWSGSGKQPGSIGSSHRPIPQARFRSLSTVEPASKPLIRLTLEVMRYGRLENMDEVELITPPPGADPFDDRSACRGRRPGGSCDMC